MKKYMLFFVFILSILSNSSSGVAYQYNPLEEAQREVSMNMDDFRTGRPPGSSYNNYLSQKMQQKVTEDAYREKLIKRRNTGIEALMGISASKRSEAYPKLIKMLESQGANIDMPENYDEETLRFMLAVGI